MDKAGIPFLSATALSELIKSREVSPVEAAEAYLERVDNLDFKLNAYLTVCCQEALRAAHEAEGAIANGGYLGPMHGIPVAVKDQLWTKGVRSTGGSRFLADFIPDEDATAIANLKTAGAVLLGKTNLTEFALSPSVRYSSPRNPWDLDLYAGPSSSGSGAATAAFLCATSLGEDTSGSIRFPASWCGLVGLKPSWGRVSRYGLMRGVWSMDAVGPMSRTVADAAMTLGAIAGYDPKDPYSWKSPVSDYAQCLDGEVQGIRVGVIKEQLDSGLVDAEVREAVLKALSVLRELGASVGEVSLPLIEYAFILSWVYVFVEPASNHRDWVRHRLQDYGHANRIGFLTGSITPAQTYYKAQKLRGLLRQQVDAALERYDVLVLPTLGKTAQAIEDEQTITSKETAMPLPYILTPVFSLTGGPAVSVPCGLDSRGLPIGLQIGGRCGADGMVLRVAHAYEQGTPWHSMRPPAA